MFSKFFQKQGASPQSPTSKSNVAKGSLTPADLNPRVIVHYGIPSTASILACDLIQRLVAVGTLDGRIKVIGGENIEALLVSPKQLPFKNLEFLQNQGFLVSVSNENEIQVWDLEQRNIASSLKWESNITAFKVIHGTSYMYLGDEHGFVSVVKYDAEQHKLVLQPYYVPTNVIADAAGISSPSYPSVVGVLPQPCSQGNRVLIAYETGLLVIWDVSEDRIVLVRGNKDLQFKGETKSGSSKENKIEVSDCTSDSDEADKEITALCWASDDGSILAVGYVDGDIMFWNLSASNPGKDQKAENLHKNVVKLQLSSGEKRLPVIVLRWSANQSASGRGCKLFVYGGDKIGSQEVLTILSLEWPGGIESLKCVGRVDLTLNGSYADTVLLPTVGEMESGGNLLFVLTNPGQLHVYDDACLAACMSRQEKNPCVSSGQYVMPISTVAPCMTVSKLGLLHRDGELSKALSKVVSAAKLKAPDTPTPGTTRWPLTGGIPSLLNEAADYQVERVYVTGYHDGSVQIWDATYPALSLIFVLGTEVPGVDIAGASASVSALEICSFTQSLAIGTECGMVRLYKLTGTSDEMSLSIVKETEKEVHTSHQADGPRCTAVFSLLNSPVCELQFAKSGTRLAVGFSCGRVAMLDVSTISVLFITDSLSHSNCPVASLAMHSFTDTDTLVNSPKESGSTILNDEEMWLAFIMTKDACLTVLDGTTGLVVSNLSIPQKPDSNAISMYILDGGDIISAGSSETIETTSEPAHSSTEHGITPVEAKAEISAQLAHFGQRSNSLLILLCFEDALHLCSLKSVIQGTTDSIKAVNLLKPCCWTSVFKKDDKECGLVLLYRNGDLEIRSLKTLDVVGESSLMNILRWNFKTNMEKTICSSNRGQILLIHGYEFAAISILALENDFRIPDSLPCIHDTVLAAAFDATLGLSPSQNKSQDTSPGILGGIIKSLQGGKLDQNAHVEEACKNDLSHLERIFSYPPFLKPSVTSTDGQDFLDLNIDDIQIDEPLIISSSSGEIKIEKEKKTERERLFEGAATDAKPKLRTPDEIRVKYRGSEDAAAAAARAMDRLIERQEKLERINERSQELQNGAEDFASMAKELAKRMEKKKWWNL
ncbi:Synaptobrevin [Corchorus capsularis]|uniref:Synaptobrevin n=1 Tax=Corchorus capsularis TaxID=210143 RepID=A0A1R3FW39_COCAP|nr:Synaptobrevin [Corchorus capsularis]